jgi:hypothetical protein
LPIVGKSLVVADCVEADAVEVKPVSTPQFPAIREKNRELFWQNKEFWRRIREFCRPNEKASTDGNVIGVLT